MSKTIKITREWLGTTVPTALEMTMPKTSTTLTVQDLARSNEADAANGIVPKKGRTDDQKAARRKKDAAKLLAKRNGHLTADERELADLQPSDVAALNGALNEKKATEVIEEKADGTIVEPTTIYAAVEAKRPTVDFLSLGYAVALADLAEAKGMTVADVVSLPELLAEAGLPKLLGPSVRGLAHQIDRNKIDATLFRCNRPLAEKAPELSRTEAAAVVASPAPAKKMAAAVAKVAGTSMKVGVARNQIHGQAATRVVMWMGKDGLSAAQATKVLAHYGVQSTPASIATFLRSGVKGDRGEPAKLTDAQAEEVRKIANG